MNADQWAKQQKEDDAREIRVKRSIRKHTSELMGVAGNTRAQDNFAQFQLDSHDVLRLSLPESSSRVLSQDAIDNVIRIAWHLLKEKRDFPSDKSAGRVWERVEEFSGVGHTRAKALYEAWVKRKGLVPSS